MCVFHLTVSMHAEIHHCLKVRLTHYAKGPDVATKSKHTRQCYAREIGTQTAWGFTQQSSKAHEEFENWNAWMHIQLTLCLLIALETIHGVLWMLIGKL